MTDNTTERNGIYLSPMVLRLGMVLMGLTVVGILVAQFPAIRRYAKMESM